MLTTSFLLRLTSAMLLLLFVVGTSTLSYAVPVSLIATQRLPSSHSPRGPTHGKPSALTVGTTQKPGTSAAKPPPGQPIKSTDTSAVTGKPVTSKSSTSKPSTSEPPPSVPSKPPPAISTDTSSVAAKPSTSKTTTSSNAHSSNAPTCPRSLPKRKLESRVENSLITTIQAWAKENVDKIEGAQALKGGWEGWAQVELALYLQKKLASGSNLKDPSKVVDREGTYQGSNLKWDLRVQENQLDTANFIELKCQTAAEKFQDIKERVQADVTKVNAGTWPSGSTVWVMAFSVEANSETGKTDSKTGKADSNGQSGAAAAAGGSSSSDSAVDDLCKGVSNLGVDDGDMGKGLGREEEFAKMTFKGKNSNIVFWYTSTQVRVSQQPSAKQ